MKNIATESKKILHYIQRVDNVMCQCIMTPDGYRDVTEPFLSSEHACEYCGGADFYTPCKNEGVNSHHKIWLCGNMHCVVNTAKKRVKPTQPTGDVPRALEWVKFCEINGIGDLRHDVRFEKINQPSKQIDYLRKFAQKPVGLIVMQGKPGNGKTYACLGVCELFTRHNESAMFIKQEKMCAKWLEEQKIEFTKALEFKNLLVVDDFGTGEVSPGFMKFFLDMIDTRLQWSNRGTIMTTNLDDKQFVDYCGEALNDRVKTGQKIIFKDISRRKPTTL